MKISKIATNNFNLKSSTIRKINPLLSSNISYFNNKGLSSLDFLANQNLPLVNRISKTQDISFGSNESKIPKYLYHLTTKRAYESMCRTGIILTSSEKASNVQGVFTFEMDNFLKYWDLEDSEGRNINRKLFNRLDVLDSELALLRIPTAKLNVDELKIRSQNIYFDKYKYQHQLNKELAAGVENPTCYKPYRATIDHFMNGDSAYNIDKYDGHAVEYIYPHEISMDMVELVGFIRPEEFKHCDDFVFESLKKLMQNQPEAYYFE